MHGTMAAATTRKTLRRRKLFEVSMVCFMLTVYTGIPIGSKFITPSPIRSKHTYPGSAADYVSFICVTLSWAFLTCGGMGLLLTYMSHRHQHLDTNKYRVIVGLNACVVAGGACIMVAEVADTLQQVQKIRRGGVGAVLNIVSIVLLGWVVVHVGTFMRGVVQLIREVESEDVKEKEETKLKLKFKEECESDGELEREREEEESEEHQENVKKGSCVVAIQ